MQKVITVYCPHCGSDDLAKYGFAPDGRQRYRCRACQRQHREDPRPHGYSEERKAEILRATQERSSLRGIQRTFGTSRQTISSWLKKKVDQLPELETTLAGRDLLHKTLELDEVWSFVLKKSEQNWTWIALCATTRQVVAFVTGDRTKVTCRRLWNAVPECYKTAHCFSDFWQAYRAVLPDDQHQAVGKESGKTNHVERWNNTLRQCLAQFVRKTLSFSKCPRMHLIRLTLFIHRYNTDLAHTIHT